MKLVADFTRAVAVFLVIQAFIGILTPSAKYKNYIDLIMGLILISIVLPSISGILSSEKYPFEEIFTPVQYTNTAVYEDKQNELILNNYKEELENQILDFAEQNMYGDYSVTNVQVEVVEKGDEFGALTAIYIDLSDTRKQRGILRIEKVTVKLPGSSADDNANIEEHPEINKLKKAISDFYNLSVGNIHITVQKK